MTMGLKLSSQNPPRLRTYSGSSPGPSGAAEGFAVARNGGSSASGGARARARSLGSFQTPGHSSLSIPSASGGGNRSNSPDSDSSTPEDGVFGRAFTHSLPVHLISLQGFPGERRNLDALQAVRGIKCPVCSKPVPADDVECHLVMCLTKPRINYNEDVLSDDKGECVICFDELVKGDTIARLPCLCIYHKGCIDKWFEKNRSCPEHPTD